MEGDFFLKKWGLLPVINERRFFKSILDFNC